MKITHGMIIKPVNFGDFTAEVHGILEKSNQLLVTVTGNEKTAVPHNEIWNLAHTIQGFKNNDYCAV